MSVIRRKKLWAAGLACGAMLFQVLPSGCRQYFAASALTAFDFCSVFNCTGGTYFNLCGDNPLFVDCPNFAPAEEQ